MGKFVEVRVELDDTAPEYLSGTIRCRSVRAYDANGRMVKDFTSVIDNTPYQSKTDLVYDVAKRINLPVSMFSVVDD